MLLACTPNHQLPQQKRMVVVERGLVDLSARPNLYPWTRGPCCLTGCCIHSYGLTSASPSQLCTTGGRRLVGSTVLLSRRFARYAMLDDTDTAGAMDK
jgi:hypothetical protein